MIILFDINFLNWLFCDFDFDIDLLREWLSLVSLIVIEHFYVLYSLVVISILSLIILESKANKNLKTAGQVGTGGLAVVGGVESILNLYDRFTNSRGNQGSYSGGGESGGSKDSYKNKGNNDNNKQSPDNKGDNNSNSNTK